MLEVIERLQPRSLKYLSGHLSRLVAGRLWLKVLIGMVLGIAAGIAMGPSAGWIAPPTAAVIGNWLALPGHLFLVLIQMIVVPLIFASIIRGLTATENVEQLKRLGFAVAAFFIVTTTLAITVGVTLALLVKPGTYVDSDVIKAALGGPSTAIAGAPVGAPNLADIPGRLIGLFPANPLTSMVENQMLQVVVFSVIFGLALLMTSPDRARPLLEFLGSLQEVCMTVVRGAMHLAPLAVFGLMAQLAAKIGVDALLGMLVYVLTVLGGLAAMLALYLALVAVAAQRYPLVFLRDIRDVVLLAFSTSSSAAVMPLSIKTAEERLGVRPSISQFVIPIGATINMNGTALYQGVATIFLAQVFGVDLSSGALVVLVVVAVGASIGSPATPGVGIVILAMVLDSVGIPPSGVALIMGVDRILDMSRTAVNVSGDLVACVVMDRWIGGDSTAEEEHEREIALESRRRETGADVVIETKA